MYGQAGWMYHCSYLFCLHHLQNSGTDRTKLTHFFHFYIHTVKIEDEESGEQKRILQTNIDRINKTIEVVKNDEAKVNNVNEVPTKIGTDDPPPSSTIATPAEPPGSSAVEVEQAQATSSRSQGGEKSIMEKRIEEAMQRQEQKRKEQEQELRRQSLKLQQLEVLQYRQQEEQKRKEEEEERERIAAKEAAEAAAAEAARQAELDRLERERIEQERILAEQKRIEEEAE